MLVTLKLLTTKASVKPRKKTQTRGRKTGETKKNMVDISLLNSNNVKEIIIDETINYDKEYYKNTDITNLSDVKILGNVTKMDTGELELNLNSNGVMTLPCSITLEPVEYPFSVTISEIIDEKDENNLKKDANTLGLKDYLRENIVVEIPLRIVSDNAYKKEYKGNGWQLITDETKKVSNKDNPFEALNQLLDKE